MHRQKGVMPTKARAKEREREWEKKRKHILLLISRKRVSSEKLDRIFFCSLLCWVNSFISTERHYKYWIGLIFTWDLKKIPWFLSKNNISRDDCTKYFQWSLRDAHNPIVTLIWNWISQKKCACAIKYEYKQTVTHPIPRDIEPHHQKYKSQSLDYIAANEIIAAFFCRFVRIRVLHGTKVELSLDDWKAVKGEQNTMKPDNDDDRNNMYVDYPQEHL